MPMLGVVRVVETLESGAEINPIWGILCRRFVFLARFLLADRFGPRNDGDEKPSNGRENDR